MSGGPGASALFPFGQEQQNHQPHWGVYADANSLPNAPGNVLVVGKFENLAVGHLAWSVAEGATYQCVSVGTAGGGDATWTAIGFLVYTGAGDPEGVVVAPPGALYLNTVGGLNESVFTKVSGVGNVGWDRFVMVDRASGRVFIGQNVTDHGSNAGLQFSSATGNRAQFRGNQYGANAAGAGITGFKSRGPIGGPDVGVADGDLLFRATAIGVTGDGLLIPLAGTITIQVPSAPGTVQPTYVPTEFDLQLVPTEGLTNSIRSVFKVTSQGVPVLRETIAANAPNTDPAAGVATLGAAGAVVVANKNVKAGTRFLLTVQDGGTLASGIIQVTARTVGVDFTITSSAAAADAGAVVYWQLWEGA